MRDASEGIEQARKGGLNVFYHIPADFVESMKVYVYVNAPEQSLFANYQMLVDSLLKQSALIKMTPVDQVVMMGMYGVEVTSYVDGEEDNFLGKMIVPIVALGIFYVLICMFGNRLMMATLEEKENRISEMILTSISSKTMIVGKIISLIALGFLQVLILVLPMVVGYLNSGKVSVGGISVQEILPSIVWDPWMVVMSVLLLISSYVLFTGLCVMIGALVPTAKEASNFTSVVMILVIMPLFFLSSFMSNEPDAATYVLSYFPFSAPVALMMRNAFGTLPPVEAVIGLAVIVASSVVVIWLAVKIFQYGAIEFSSRVRIGQALNPKEWK
jgi:ABC-2 type transport system permease protein